MSKKVLNATGMKHRNRKEILENLRLENISRAELSRRTGLTRAGISIIIDELLSENIIIEGNSITGKVGRTSIELMLNPDYCYMIGIDIARDYCTVGIGDFKGEVRQVCRLEYNEDSANAHLEKICELIKDLQESNSCRGIFWGIGITAPGPLDVQNGKILNPPNFSKWENVEMVKYLEEQFECPVFLENNAKALALAEKYYGIGKQLDNYVELTVDTGIGGGMMINGKLFQGSSFLGGDFGHMSIQMDGPQCSCGNDGCSEIYASIPNIEKYASEKIKEKITWRQIVDKACAGDKVMQEVVGLEVKYLALIITNITNIMDTEAVILASEINYRSEYLIPLIQKRVDHQILGREMKKVAVLSSKMEKNSRVLSGLNLVVNQLINR